MSIALQEQVRQLLAKNAANERAIADITERLVVLEKKAKEQKPLGLNKNA